MNATSIISEAGHVARLTEEVIGIREQLQRIEYEYREDRRIFLNLRRYRLTVRECLKMLERELQEETREVSNAVRA